MTRDRFLNGLFFCGKLTESIGGAIATAGNPVNLSIVGMVRDCCPDSAMTLTVELVEGAGNVANIATTVIRL